MYFSNALKKLSRFRAQYAIDDYELEWIRSENGVDRFKYHVIDNLSKSIAKHIVQKIYHDLEVTRYNENYSTLYHVDFVLMSKSEYNHLMDMAIASDSANSTVYYADSQDDNIVEAEFIEITVPLLE